MVMEGEYPAEGPYRFSTLYLKEYSAPAVIPEETVTVVYKASFAGRVISTN